MKIIVTETEQAESSVLAAHCLKIAIAFISCNTDIKFNHMQKEKGYVQGRSPFDNKGYLTKGI